MSSHLLHWNLGKSHVSTIFIVKKAFSFNLSDGRLNDTYKRQTFLFEAPYICQVAAVSTVDEYRYTNIENDAFNTLSETRFGAKFLT